ncbi:UDP-N-acetylmuramate--L-alanine ligase [bacterium HR20]|nr:UDP-N-acetylmuramate--L-alanine ligase [bacterium HR20]
MKHIHFVGIGGIGMSGLAEVVHARGFSVSGSDLVASENTAALSARGIRIDLGHAAEHVRGADLVVYSSAVNPDTNPETLQARQLGIPIIRRAELLAHVTRLGKSLAIAGTHGKTTTTSLCGLVLIAGGYDPTVIVGGRLHDFGGSNARIGSGEWFVVEADEYDRSFLQLTPTVAVITNIEPEHLDVYGSFSAIEEAFEAFARNVSLLGALVVCGDDPGCQRLAARLPHRVVTYGFGQHCAICAADVHTTGSGSIVRVVRNGQPLGDLRLKIPGEHNIANALAAVAVGFELDIPFSVIADALAEFGGVIRRFHMLGEYGGVVVVDDYAHHPTEIRATLRAARQRFPERRIVAVFQPHTYTRTRDFASAFADALSQADIVMITDVYAAREAPIEGISGRTILEQQVAPAEGLRSSETIAAVPVHPILRGDGRASTGRAEFLYAPTLDDVKHHLGRILQPGDVLLTMGAGNIVQIAQWFCQAGTDSRRAAD